MLKSELANLIVVENDSDCENIFQIEKNMRVLTQIFFVTLEEVMVVLYYAALQIKVANVVALHDCARWLLLLLTFHLI